MSSRDTRFSANVAVDYMLKINFTPKTILNIGLGRCSEIKIWKSRIPEVNIFGVDVRGWQICETPYVNALVSDKEYPFLTFCKDCNSIKCNDNTHNKKKIDRVKTIDGIVKENNLIAPFFLWMDIEGGEIDALNGSLGTLNNTPLINIEIREFIWNNNYGDELNKCLNDNGYYLVEDCDYGRTQDKLYKRKDYFIQI
jgi:hypothetical protein